MLQSEGALRAVLRAMYNWVRLQILAEIVCGQSIRLDGQEF